MPSVHPHMLRHTYVTTMLDAGVDLRDVQIAAGHADPRTTMRYDRARNQRSRLAEAVTTGLDSRSRTERSLVKTTGDGSMQQCRSAS